MLKHNLKRSVQAFVALLFVGLILDFATPVAEGRAGGGSSRGRSGGWSSRPSSPPPRSAPQPPPAPGQPGVGSAGNPGMAQPAVSPAGGFMRSMAGGIAGGFLGSMLFGSLGNAAGLGGAGGGGFGLVEMLLFGGLAYVGFRWWKSRQPATNAYGGTPLRYTATNFGSQRSEGQQPIDARALPSLTPPGIETEQASDIFFRIQGAWTRRDLTPIAGSLGNELKDSLEIDLAQLRNKKLLNRLENISIRNIEVLTSWAEGGEDFSTVRFTANLLDYKVDEATGKVVEGSDTEPSKFEEDWTFAKSSRGTDWRLESIEQV